MGGLGTADVVLERGAARVGQGKENISELCRVDYPKQRPIYSMNSWSFSGGYFPRTERLSALKLSKMLNQQFGENSDFPCGVLTGRADDEQAARWDRIARHDRNKGAGIQIAHDETIRKPRDAEPRHRGSGESGTVVRFELPLRMNGNCLVAIEKLPGFRSLHEGLMRKEFIRRLWSSVLPDVSRARDELPMDWSDATRDQVRVVEIADAYRTIETLSNDIHEAIAVARMHVEQRVATRQFCKHRRQMRRSQG